MPCVPALAARARGVHHGNLPDGAVPGSRRREQDAFLSRRWLRYLLAALLGGITGLALCHGVLPLGLQLAGYGSYMALDFYLDRFCWVSVVLMALGGLGVARAKHTLEAVKAFSFGGLLAGAGVVALGLDHAPRLLAAGGLLGWLYGLPAGLLLQAVLSGLPGGRAVATAPNGIGAAGATCAGASGAGDPTADTSRRNAGDDDYVI